MNAFHDGTSIIHSTGQFAFVWEKTRLKRDGLLLRAHITDDPIARLSFVSVTRDEHTDVELTGPDTQIGRCQIAELRDCSTPDAFEMTGGEAVILEA